MKSSITRKNAPQNKKPNHVLDKRNYISHYQIEIILKKKWFVNKNSINQPWFRIPTDQ